MDIHHRFSSRKRKQVRKACLNCQKAHSGCGEQRPCPRCVKRKEEHCCIDAPRKKRKDLVDEMEGSFPPSPIVRKRRLPCETTRPEGLLVKVERAHKHHHPDSDDDYIDSNVKGLAVRTNKRPRRHTKLQRPMSSNTLAIPLHFKAAKQEQHTEDFSCCPVDTRNTHNNNSCGGSKVATLPTPQLNTKDDCNTFLFNPLEFDCVVPPERQLPLAFLQPQRQPTPVDELSLEWLLPDLCFVPASITPIAPAFMCGQELPSSFLFEEEDTPLFFSDYHTFEPLFSF